MTKAKPRTVRVPPVPDDKPVGYMEGKTLVIDMHAAGQGPHWLSGSRKPTKAKKPPAKVELHIGAVPPEDDIEANVKFVVDMYRAITGKESTPADIERAREVFTAKTTRPKPGVSD